MRILYAEDEMQLSRAVTEILKLEGFDVMPVYDGQQALDAMKNDYFDAVVLDIMMPVKDGIEVLNTMREEGNYTAVLMLTAKATVDDRINGLAAGADDYLAKPFAIKELVARLNSLIRRGSSYRHSVVGCANITLDESSGELRSDKGSLRLSNHESELLSYLIHHPNAPVTATELNERVFNGKETPEKAQLYIFYLKNKLRQIRSDVNILICNDSYSLGETDL